jgi:phage-related protein
MTINEGTQFIYANQSSEEFGVFLCSIGSINTDSNDESYEYIQSTTPFMDKWHYHGKVKSEPLQFKITIAQSNGNFIDSEKERQLKKWLCKSNFYWLQVDQKDLNGVNYFCIMSIAEKNNVAKMTGGITLNVLCNSVAPWSNLNTKSYTSSGTLTFAFNNISDYDDYILYPKVTITPSINGNISIANTTTGVTVTINNCTNGEVITLDCKNNKIKSSNVSRILLDDWNKKYLSFKSGINNITLTGSFIMKLEYRTPIRVGG